VFLSVSIFGSLDGNGKQESESVASALEDGFIAGDINFKVSSRLMDELMTVPKKENEQTNHLSFTADVHIYYP
jgi:signal recognition particle GTPase